MLRVAWTLRVGGFAVLFDTTIVAVAIDSLATELHVGLDVIQWVSTGYLLALGVTVPLVGWAQKALGSKRLWMIALALFLVGSVLCNLAWDAPSLIAFRVIQGIGGGIVMPLMMTLLVQAALLAPSLVALLYGLSNASRDGGFAHPGVWIPMVAGLGERIVVLVAFAVVAVATIPFAFATGSTSEWWLMAVLLVRGLGLGLVMIPIMGVAFRGLAHSEIPDASIVTRLFQQLGGSFGTAVLATILTSVATSGTDPVVAFSTAFWWAIGFTALAVVLALLLPGREKAAAPA